MAADGGGAASGPRRAGAPGAPPAIRKLDENVVNKIAAGEVIQRPASALKEMLENSLDAGSTQITVLVKDGGNKLLQITDNGSGIRKEDLPILCHRHTTSKLREYEDLETISTLGFRGEALCSISFVSHMSVTTMARGAQYGYRVTFKDSEMEPPGPKPVAAVPGTTITVEDLFYNVPTRRKALKSASEEYGLILDVLGRYAVYSTGVAFSCRRQGDSRADISTTAAGSRLDAIRSVYGADVARELLPLRVVAGGGTGPEVPVEGPMGLGVEGLISGANYSSGKKTVLVLFINGRCVECSPLRRALEGLYATLLPKASRPWLFLDVRLPPRQVEVNMHPTKREVGFMHQEEVIEEIRNAVEVKLLASNESRTFAASATLQTQLPFAALPLASQLESAGVGGPSCGREMAAVGGEEEESQGDGGVAKRRRRDSGSLMDATGGQGNGEGEKRPVGGGAAGGAPVPYRPEKLVRVDYRAGTLDTFVIPKGASGSSGANQAPQAGATAARAAAAGGNVPRRRTAAARHVDGGPLSSDPAGLPSTSGRDEGFQRGHSGGRALPPSLVTAEVLGLGPYVSEPAQDEGSLAEGDEFGGDPGGGGGPGLHRPPPRRAPPPVVTQDASVLELLAEAERGAHAGLGDVLREHTFVGVADGSLALVQHSTRLYLVDVGALSRDMFYQLALRRWDQPLRLQLELPPQISELVALGLQLLQVKGEWQPEDGSPEELGELVTELLQQNGPALERQLGIAVDDKGRLLSVPLLLEGLLPDPARLPDLVMALAKDVDWDEPRERVRAIAWALADMYAARPPLLLPDDEAAMGTTSGRKSEENDSREAGQGLDDASRNRDVIEPPESQDGSGVEGRAMGGGRAESIGGRSDGLARHAAEGVISGRTGSNDWKKQREEALTTYEYQVRNVILPAMRGCLKPPRVRATDGCCVQVAALERLYRIFERC